MVGGARVEEGAATSLAAAVDKHPAAADPTTREAREQILRVRLPWGASPQSAAGAPQVVGAGLGQPRMGTGPRLVGDDPQVRGGDGDPFGVWSLGHLRLAPGVAFLRLVPHDLAAVERALENLADRGGDPAQGTALLGSRGWCGVGIEALRDACHAESGPAEVKDATHDVGFRLVDAAFDVPPPSPTLGIRFAHDLDVVVAEDATAGDMTGAGLPRHRVGGALAGFLPFHFVRECRDGQQQLVGRGLQGAFPVFQ